MSVSYHLIPVDKETGASVDLNDLSGNNFSLFAELLINYPDRFLDYFDKHELFFDFVFCLQNSEVSKITYQPENLKALFIELLDILKTRPHFPIESFHYFGYEDVIELTVLYVNMKGSELNKIVEDKIYDVGSDYEVNTFFDKWNNYNNYGDTFAQKTTTVYIKNPNEDRLHSNLDISAFPGTLKINGTLRNIQLGREIKEIHLIEKTPYEHLKPMFEKLIKLCEVCEAKGIGLKSYIEC